MPLIKFSHPYIKLTQVGPLYGNTYQISTATLLQVIPIDLADITAELRAQDTFFYEGTTPCAYQLPAKGAYLLLIFSKPGGVNLFTSIRRSTPEKLEYYQRSVGQEFDIVITQKEAAV